MCTSPEQYARRSLCRSGRTLLAMAFAALILVASPAGAQDGGASVDAGSQITLEARRMMGSLAEAHMAEMEAGQLALEKSGSQQVRAFARQVVDEHSADLQALRTLAQARGVTLPDETTIRSKSQGVALKALSGSLFDRQYLKRMGISEHQRMIGLLQEMQKTARDPELQALLGQMLSSAQSHMQKARQISVRRGLPTPAGPP